MVTLYCCVCFLTILSTVFCTNKSMSENLTNGDIIIMEDQKSFNILLKGNVIPIIQKRMNNDAVKRSMDNFSMVRRKTHFLMPGVHVNSVTVNGNAVVPGAIRGTTYRTVNIESYKYNGHGYDKVKEIQRDMVITKGNGDVFNKIDKNPDKFNDQNRNFDKTNDINHNFPNVNDRIDIYEDNQGLGDNFVKNKINNLDQIDNLHSNLINMQSRGYFDAMNDINNLDKKKNVYAKFNDMHQNFIVKNKPGPSDKIKVLTDNFDNSNKITNFNNAAEGNYAKLNNINEISNGIDSKIVQRPPIADYYNEISNIYEQLKVQDFDDYFTYEQELELLKILRKQEEIIKNITDDTVTTRKKKKKRPGKHKESTEWDDILKNVEEQRNKTKNSTEFTFETTTVTTTTTTTPKSTTLKPATILTVLNEMDVRTALKNDPYVKRILKMANKKRQKYIKNALLTIYN